MSFPPPSPPAPPPSTTPSPSSTAWWRRKKLGIPVWALITLIVALIAAGAVGANQKKNSTTSSPPATAQSLGPRMTKASGIDGVPLPDDAVVFGSPRIWMTQAGSLEALSAFYQSYMISHGWTFDEQFSTLDSKSAEAEALGHISNGVYCQNTKPIKTAIIIVGVGTAGGTEISIVDSPDEAFCP